MQHYVQLQIQHFRICINEILQSNTLHDFVQKYNTFINTTQNLKNSNFLNNDLSVVSNYVVEQFIFKKQEIIQHIEKSLEYKLNVKCKDEVEQLLKKNLQEHISKIQSLDDLRSSNFNISNIEILVQDFDLKLRIQKILNYIAKVLNQQNDIKKMYNNFAYTICNIACEITQKKKEKDFNKIETTWKSLLQENADKINLIKEKIDLYKKSNSNSIEQFPLDSICAIILAHKYNKLFSDYHFANILITDDYNNIHAKYFPYISSLKYYMDCLIEDLGIDSNIIKNVFYNLVLHNRQEIINKLLSLQCNSQDWLSPFIIKMIYDTTSNAKTFDDLEPFFSLNNIDYIKIKINKILEENNLLLEQYYIKTNNLWGAEYVDSELQVMYARGEYDAVSASLKEEVNKMPNSELKNKYLNILSKDREKCAIVDANEDCTQDIDIIENEIKKIICSSTKDNFIESYLSFVHILIKMHRRIKRLFPENTKGEEISKQIMNDFIVRVWEIYNDINVQNKIKNILNNNNDNYPINKHYEQRFHNLNNILNSIEFQNKTPIDQFKQLKDWYNNI